MKMLIPLVLLAVLTGCDGSFTGRAPETRTLTLAVTPPQAYTRAVQSLTAMGGQLTTMDGQRHVQGVVKGIVLLSVEVQGEGPPTQVQATGSIVAGKLTIGTFTELDELCQRLTATEGPHGR
jgi:hypothetical protein